MRPAIPLVDLHKGYLAHREEINSAVQRVLDSGWYILGDEVTSFENAFAEHCGVREAIGVGNGTDAIVLALRALGIGEGDVVFTVSHTAVATVAAIEMTGATPVLVDINPQTYTIDPDKLEASVKSFDGLGGLRAVIAVHLYGQPCDLDAVLTICEKYGLALVEDCAQAHGAIYKDAHVGSFGRIATFSFYPTKNLGAFGDGGAIITNDPTLAKTCRALRQYGWFEHYLSDLAGVNSRLDELQAAVLSVRLRHLDAEIRVRRAVAAQYDTELRNVVQVPATFADRKHAYHLYVVRSTARDALRTKLAKCGIGSGVHYPLPVHLQNAYLGRVTIGAGGLSETEKAAAQILSLPMHGFLDDQNVRAVIDAIMS